MGLQRPVHESKRSSGLFSHDLRGSPNAPSSFGRPRGFPNAPSSFGRPRGSPNAPSSFGRPPPSSARRGKTTTRFSDRSNRIRERLKLLPNLLPTFLQLICNQACQSHRRLHSARLQLLRSGLLASSRPPLPSSTPSPSVTNKRKVPAYSTSRTSF